METPTFVQERSGTGEMNRNEETEFRGAEMNLNHGDRFWVEQQHSEREDHVMERHSDL